MEKKKKAAAAGEVLASPLNLFTTLQFDFLPQNRGFWRRELHCSKDGWRYQLKIAIIVIRIIVVIIYYRGRCSSCHNRLRGITHSTFC